MHYWYNHQRRLGRSSIRDLPSGRHRETELAYLHSGEGRQVLLVDDRLPFRRAIATALADEQVSVIEATGVYDAFRRLDQRSVRLIVICGNLQLQGGWRCAAKLCGTPPWGGVIMHFDWLGAQERKWGHVSGLEGLVETSGRPERVVESVLQVLETAGVQAVA